MNQATNLIQWRNLTDEQKAEFDFENYKYQFQSEYEWTSSTAIRGESAGYDLVYRLVIEDDKWYFYREDSGMKVGFEGVDKGKNLDLSPEEYRTLRPARPDFEIPQPEKTLEQKIQEKWPDKEVVMLQESTCYKHNREALFFGESDNYHVVAQSMKGFYKYVYEIEGELVDDREATVSCLETGKTIQPIAVLFNKES